ncbi:unnamed protein product [Ectocarpus sp. 8 AP-2014]
MMLFFLAMILMFFIVVDETSPAGYFRLYRATPIRVRKLLSKIMLSILVVLPIQIELCEATLLIVRGATARLGLAMLDLLVVCTFFVPWILRPLGCMVVYR